MKLLKLKLRGFIGIQKGLCRDEIEIDFSNLTGLIALAGPNGHGKTTILDNLHPYRCLASRNKGLQHHVYLRDSSRELSFLYRGDEYRILVKIDSHNGNQEGFVWKNGEPQVDGKVKNYDAYIENLFGSESLFFASVFAAQGGKKLSDMTTGELKKLISEFLRLEKLVEYEETAKKAGNRIETEAAMITRQIAGKVEQADKLRESADKLPDTETAIAVLEKERLPEVRAQKEAIEDEIKRLSDIIASQESDRARLDEMRAERNRLNDAIGQERRTTDKAITETNKKATRLEAEIEETKALLDREKEIRTAAELVEDLTAQLNKQHEVCYEAGQSETQAAMAVTDAKNNLAARKVEIDRVRADQTVKVLENKLAGLKEQAADLDRRDPNCTSETCSFIVRALEAKKLIPAVERDISDAWKEQSKKITELERNLGALFDAQTLAASKHTEARETLEKARADRDNIAKRIEAEKALAAELPKIEAARTRLDALRESYQDASDSAISLAKAADLRIVPLKERRQVLAESILELGERVESGVTAKKAIEEERAGLAGIVERIKITEEQIAQYKTAAALYTRDIEALAETEKEIDSLRADHKQMTNEVADWRYIQKACGKDGLRALEIDSVAPTISAYANDLLAKTFGPAHTIRFLTQDPETGREILDILVIREDGTETPLENLSGGEKVWSLKALRLAMTLIAKERSGLGFETSYADEEDGALDADNAINFIRMYQAFMGAGGFKDCLFISHRPECVDMADYRLQFGDGEIQAA